MFELPEEHRMLQDLVAKFIDRDVMPLEKSTLEREATGGRSGLPPEDEEKLLAKCKELGLWGLDVPEEYGGSGRNVIAAIAFTEAMAEWASPRA